MPPAPIKVIEVYPIAPLPTACNSGPLTGPILNPNEAYVLGERDNVHVFAHWSDKSAMVSGFRKKPEISGNAIRPTDGRVFHLAVGGLNPEWGLFACDYCPVRRNDEWNFAYAYPPDNDPRVGPKSCRRVDDPGVLKPGGGFVFRCEQVGNTRDYHDENGNVAFTLPLSHIPVMGMTLYGGILTADGFHPGGDTSVHVPHAWAGGVGGVRATPDGGMWVVTGGQEHPHEKWKIEADGTQHFIGTLPGPPDNTIMSVGRGGFAIDACGAVFSVGRHADDGSHAVIRRTVGGASQVVMSDKNFGAMDIVRVFTGP